MTLHLNTKDSLSLSKRRNIEVHKKDRGKERDKDTEGNRYTRIRTTIEYTTNKKTVRKRKEK